MGVNEMQTVVMPIIHEYLVDGNLRDAVVRVLVHHSVTYVTQESLRLLHMPAVCRALFIDRLINVAIDRRA